jgi:hypothetical protein
MAVVVAVIGMAGIVAEDGAEGQASADSIPVAAVAAPEAAMTPAMEAAAPAMTPPAMTPAAMTAPAVTAPAVTAPAVAVGIGAAGGAAGQDQRCKCSCDGFAVHDAACSAQFC